MASRSHCRTGYNCHWGALQADCAQQRGTTEWLCRGSTIQLYNMQGEVNYTSILYTGGQLYNLAPGARPGHLSRRGGRNPGASSVVGGTSQDASNNPGGGKRVEWATPVLPAVELSPTTTMGTWLEPSRWLQKLPADGDFPPRAPTPKQPWSDFDIVGLPCGSNGFKLIRRMSESSC